MAPTPKKRSKTATVSTPSKRRRKHLLKEGEEGECAGFEEGFAFSWSPIVASQNIFHAAGEKGKSDLATVQFSRFVDDETGKKLEEQVEIEHLRPEYPKDIDSSGLNVGDEVDYFHDDCWWEGKVVATHHRSTRLVLYANEVVISASSTRNLRRGMTYDTTTGRWSPRDSSESGASARRAAAQAAQTPKKRAAPASKKTTASATPRSAKKAKAASAATPSASETPAARASSSSVKSANKKVATPAARRTTPRKKTVATTGSNKSASKKTPTSSTVKKRVVGSKSAATPKGPGEPTRRNAASARKKNVSRADVGRLSTKEELAPAATATTTKAVESPVQSSSESIFGSHALRTACEWLTVAGVAAVAYQAAGLLHETRD